MDLPNLLVDIHPLPPLHLFALLQLAVVIQRRLLPPRGLLFADDGLSGDTVEYIAPLRRQSLEIGCHVAGREVGRRLPKLRLESLFFPAGVEEFNCNFEMMGQYMLLLSCRDYFWEREGVEEGWNILLLMCCSNSSYGICWLQFGHMAMATFCLLACARGT